MKVAMFWNRVNCRRRRLVVSAGLLVFLAGTNLCLLHALGRAPTGCLTAAIPSGAAPISHCGHHATPVSHDVPPAPAPAACCVSLAPVSVGVLERPDLPAPLLALAADAFALALPLPADPTVRHARAPDENPPPLALSRAPLSERAPPLA